MIKSEKCQTNGVAMLCQGDLFGRIAVAQQAMTAYHNGRVWAVGQM
jgi:hypothetical protein